MEIIRKEEDGVEFYTIALTGQSGMSQSGLAILAGVSQQALSNLEKTLTSRAPSEVLKPFTGEPLTLTTDDVTCTIDGKPVGNLKVYKSSYCAAVLKHYADPEKKLSNITDQQRAVATYSLLKFADRGITDWIQEITGWKQYRDSIKLHTDVYIRRIEHMRDHQVDDDQWMIFREAAELLLLIEKDWRVPINDYDILDGSIGKMWSAYRADQSWVRQIGSYTHCYRDQRGERDCNAYCVTELPYFRRWLRGSYVPEHLPKYLVTKYGKHATRLIYTEIGGLTDYVLGLTELKRVAPKEEQKYQDFLVARQNLQRFLKGDNQDYLY
jgi:DNA-binding XRE family transcriptional regulator